MANGRLIDALEHYTGEADSLEAFVKVATEELGADWVSTIYDVMADAPEDIQERLAHAFNYNAAITAWNELQEYLLQETPLDYQETMERIPVLEHWLSFFGAVGEEVVGQLKEKLRVQGEASHQNTAPLNEPFSSPVAEPVKVANEVSQPITVTSEQVEHIFSDAPAEPQRMQAVSDYLDGNQQHDMSVRPIETEEPQIPVMPEPIQENSVIQPVSENEQNDIVSEIVEMPDVSTVQEDSIQPVETKQVYRTDVFDPIAVSAPAQNNNPLFVESEDAWRIRRMFRQIDFIANIESWISFLCLDLGYTDFYNYRYYGFLVDILDKTIAELQEILQQPALYDTINIQQVGGVQILQNKLLAYQRQSAEAHERLSDYMPLVREDLSVDDLKKRLGGMDLSDEKEYLGPAPDGFEMIDDPYENMNEDELKKEYEKIEAEGSLSSVSQESGGIVAQPISVPQENHVSSVKNTSQTLQNGVQRKMSFTFGMKPTQRMTQTDETVS